MQPVDFADEAMGRVSVSQNLRPVPSVRCVLNDVRKWLREVIDGAQGIKEISALIFRPIPHLLEAAYISLIPGRINLPSLTREAEICPPEQSQVFLLSGAAAPLEKIGFGFRLRAMTAVCCASYPAVRRIISVAQRLKYRRSVQSSSWTEKTTLLCKGHLELHGSARILTISDSSYPV
ncbi:hypothetical protein OE88DRAFT_531849 [Heliocybe sulcata]|uniref:Uncharacterized protein n=1 Tax=Heliocybe sulcata TaxID=5364 RepID=A0A5C3MUM6_9AGAM|nr:hypothetical protein OE88DRAFT_531849 [Heliocybe sulcata]